MLSNISLVRKTILTHYAGLAWHSFEVAHWGSSSCHLPDRPTSFAGTAVGSCYYHRCAAHGAWPAVVLVSSLIVAGTHISTKSATTSLLTNLCVSDILQNISSV